MDYYGSGYIDPAVIINYLGGQTQSGVSSSLTFTAFNGGGNGLGSHTNQKQVFVAVYTVAGASGLQTSITIGGVTATRVSSISNGSANTHVCIYQLSTTATSGNIVVNCSANVDRWRIDVWEVVNANTTLYDNEFSYGVNPQTVTIDTAPGGALIGICMDYHASTLPLFTWTNITEVSETGFGATGVKTSTAAIQTTTFASVVVTATNTVSTTATQQAMGVISLQPLQ